MSAILPPTSPSASAENATRVGLVAALSAASMLFASLVSAYLVRRSFPDWRPSPALWPFGLLFFAMAASAGIEVASRSIDARRRAAMWLVAIGSALYLFCAIGALAVLCEAEGGLNPPHRAFVVLLLGVHVVHALLGVIFSIWTLRPASHLRGDEGIELSRLAIHFLTALLAAIIGLLFIVQ
ncbi:MAG: hypothetical protein ABI672_19360 [Vicinamibacteria bacterium]